MYSLSTTSAERKKHTIFLLLFLKESINQILASNKIFHGIFFVIFLFQFEKNTMRAGPQNEKSSCSGLSTFVILLGKK